MAETFPLTFPISFGEVPEVSEVKKTYVLRSGNKVFYILRKPNISFNINKE